MPEKDLSEDMLFATVEDALKKAYAENRAKGEAEPSANNISATITARRVKFMCIPAA